MHDAYCPDCGHEYNSSEADFCAVCRCPLWPLPVDELPAAAAIIAAAEELLAK